MKHVTRSLVVALLLVVGSGAVEAAQDDAATDVAAFPTPTVEPLMKIAVAIGAITILGWVLTFWTRKRRAANGRGDANIRVVASRGLGPRHHVSLIEVGGYRLLVGTGGDSITTLADLSADVSFGDELQRQLPDGRDTQREELLNMIGKFEGLDA